MTLLRSTDSPKQILRFLEIYTFFQRNIAQVTRDFSSIFQLLKHEWFFKKQKVSKKPNTMEVESVLQISNNTSSARKVEFRTK